MNTNTLRSRGFTLLEILIAIVVLVVGITGIVALFPTAIKSGNQTVVDSYASLITQSVVDAINVGVRESRYRTNPTPPAESWDYFIFEHDGVQDDINESGVIPEQYFKVSNKDFCVLLPRGTANNAIEDAEIVLHFPCPENKKGSRANPAISNLSALNDEVISPDGRIQTVTDPGGQGIFQVTKTYLLGRKIDSGAAVNPIRDEFLGELINASGTSGERLVIDPYPQYSFSFSIQRSRIDSNGNGTLEGSDFFSDNLFQVKVKVFRNFDAGMTVTKGAGLIPRNNIWIHEFVTLIST